MKCQRALSVGVVTLFPEMFKALTDFGVSGRAVRQGLLRIRFSNPRCYAENAYGTVDDRPYGGGPGMVMMPGPLCRAIRALKKQVEGPSYTIYLSPQGQRLTQKKLRSLLSYQNLILIAGRYEGIDERVVALEVDEEISIGDFVLSGGELPAMTLIDALLRHVPGVLGHEASAEQDSFSQGWLDTPHYTRPSEFEGLSVPQILLSGDHKAIKQWREEQSRLRTLQRRPDLIEELEK